MKKHFFSMVAALSMLTACGGASQQTTAEAEKFDYNVEQFADLQILRWNNLLIYRFYAIAYLDLRNSHSSKNNWFII